MKVVHAKPPMFDEIDAAFNIANRPGVIFAWGDVIYLPCGGEISPYLMAHESAHGERQKGDVEGWWRKYIADPKFRFDEELIAHVAEYQAFCDGNKTGNARNSRRLYLHAIASRLASPLYGSMVRYDEARKMIKAGAV